MTITSTLLDDGPFAASLTVSADHRRDRLEEDISAAIARLQTSISPSDQRPVQIWLEDVGPGDDDLIRHEATPYRDLLQLRRRLPAAASGLTTRAFDPAQDADAFIEVNNRAFAWHPEQSGFNRERLHDAMQEDWFDADGFRILEREGRMAGFCWTKIHADETPVLGEIYVIAVDPDFHGQGLGGPMTLAGLEWLSGRNITMANLFVESDNAAALATYNRLGFAVHATNRAFQSAPPEAS